MITMKSRVKNTLLGLGMLALAASGCKTTPNLSEQLKQDDVMVHLHQLDEIAKGNGGNRATASPGGLATAAYIKETLAKLGLKPVMHDFTTRAGKKASNIIVDIAGKTPGIRLFGAHYDSVEFGPGLNDNGTGVAILLQMIAAIQQSGAMPETGLRFAFWDAEESGVEGSAAYYQSLSDADKKQLVSYFNLDMVASRDGEILVMDADKSTVPALMAKITSNPNADTTVVNMVKSLYEGMVFASGSDSLETMVKDAYAAFKVPIKEDLTFAYNSDTGPFLKDIPTGGIAVVKESEIPQEDGTTALLFAPCYHKSCDDLSNVDSTMLNHTMKALLPSCSKWLTLPKSKDS